MSNPETKILLPRLRELGTDLIRLNNYQIFWTIFKPFLFSFLTFLFFMSEFYSLSIIALVALQFNTYVSSSHDLVHNALRLPKRWNEVLLFLLELLSLRSGNAFKVSHLNHHRCFPGHDDFEGKSIYNSFISTILSGPTYIISIYFWSLKNGSKRDKKWILTEGILIGFYVLTAILSFQFFPGLLFYFLALYITSWVYPLFTVYIPHVLNFEHPIYQTIKFRGPIISLIFANHNYHLEHHLFPSVPHQNWRKLGKRLDPFLTDKKIKTVRI